jgi:hypothetical protein
MVQLNSAPEKADGELALWIDGHLAMHFAQGMRRGPWSGMGFNLVESGGEPFEGLRLRTSMDLKINHLWLEHYIDEGAQRQNRLEKPTRVNRVWFDDIVVSKEYVGPIKNEDERQACMRTKHTRRLAGNLWCRRPACQFLNGSLQAGRPHHKLLWTVVAVLGVATTVVAQAQTGKSRRRATGAWPPFRGPGDSNRVGPPR